MKKIIYSIALLGGVFCTSHIQAQVVLEALEASRESSIGVCLEQVKDKYYGNGTHNFIYCAVMGPNGKKWLNLNLGAEYAREGSEHFNPAAVPTGNDDWKAFGSLYNYGRDSDGHEQVEYNKSSDGYWTVKPKKGYINEHVLGFYRNKSRLKTEPMYWGSNEVRWWDDFDDPCPEGYSVMMLHDIRAEYKYEYEGKQNQPTIITIPKYPDWNLVAAPVITTGSSNRIDDKTLKTMASYSDGSGTAGVFIKDLLDSHDDNFLTDYGWIRSRKLRYYSTNPFLDRGVYSVMPGEDPKNYDLGTLDTMLGYSAGAVRCVQSDGPYSPPL